MCSLIYAYLKINSKLFLPVLVRLLFPRPSGRDCQDAGAEPRGHLRLRPEHYRRGPKAALVAADHAQLGTLFLVWSALHGPCLLL